MAATVLPVTLVTTTSSFLLANGKPLAGARLNYTLDRPELDTALATAVVPLADQYVSFDTDGKLPAGFGLWANSRGNQGSRWILTITYGNPFVPLFPPMSVIVPVAASVELTTLLAGANSFPQPVV